MAAVRHLQIEYGFPSPLFAKMPRLERIIKGLRRIRGQQGKALQKRIIVPAILRQMRAYWVGIGSDYKCTMLWATVVTCFFGFMLAGELVVSHAQDFEPKKHLTFDSVAADSWAEPTLIQVSLRTSKTDPYGRGINVVVGRTGDDLCPVQAMFNYLRMRGNGEGALFKHEDGSPFTKPQLVMEVRKALESSGYCKAEYSGNSFRAGAATTAAELKIEDSIIKTLGRWESTAYLLYIRIPREQLVEVSRDLAQLGKSGGLGARL
ncbi:PREDICTED: uncharacterized protein LOC105313084 [Amphimedon queenslandica]|uniref:Tyr recombinase domain-containing protein n=2 Tax=Amphimedon queenslandica TaxID=400682 RepID=A0AAN0IM65_AMPQE|nr:PREDICTED: uncharacterized protein LOC105313084 [Amphimedon queenslandica]|eukprot:XP_011404552.1 PREDICTED: uncharacterized protein LOC105313084 [Amphimedon queenslandica]